MLVKFTLHPESSGARYLVIVRIERSGALLGEVQGFLPGIPVSLDEAFRQWRDSYWALGRGANDERLRFRDLSIQPASQENQAEMPARISPISTHSGGNPTENVTRLRQELNTWLSSPNGDWLSVRDYLVQHGRIHTNNSEQSRVLLELNDPRLRRLPWRSWEVFKNYYSDAEIAFITSSSSQPPVQQYDSVRILLIVGNSKGIEKGTQEDVETIESLRKVGAQVTILRQPEPDELIKALQEQPYEIFVFTGHSQSEQDGIVGRLELNENQNLALASITVDQLAENLGEAVKTGLQLCVFNSCDGLGLSHQFVKDLRLPIAIVMREPVPDKVAVQFLQDFFEHFAHKGKSFFTAFRKARARLEGFTQFPGITWLPAICISNLTEPPTWEQLGANRSIPLDDPQTIPSNHNDNSSSDKWKKWIFPAVAVAALVVGLLVLYRYYQSSPKDRLVSTPISSPTTASVLPGNYPERIRDIQPSPPNGSWRYGGSRSLVPLAFNLKDPIRQAFSDKFHLNEYQAIGTVEGRTRLLQGQLDFILASEKDSTPGLDYKLIARDVIAIAVNPQLQLSRGLTLEELKNIYTGKVTNWKDVGGPNLPITAFYRSLNNSGTSEYFRQTVLENGSFAPTVKSHDKDLTIIAREVKNTVGAIYFGSASEVLGQCSVKPIAIGKNANDFILPYQGAAVDNPSCPNKEPKYINFDARNQKQYPIIRDVFVAVQNTNPNSQKVGEAYANMLLTNEGQGLIKDAGFAPLYPPH